MITLKSKKEIELMEHASQLLVKVIDSIDHFISPGTSTGQLDQEIELRLRQNDLLPAFKNYRTFPFASCANLNNEVTNAIPSLHKRLHDGDLFKLQVGATYKGYNSKIQRTYIVGKTSPTIKRLVHVTKKALQVGIDSARVGNRLGDISAAIQSTVESAGYSVVKEYGGHGIGKNLHEDPMVLNYYIERRGIRLREGLVLQLLPIVNIGTDQIQILSDGWTAVTLDGKPSCLMGHIVAIEESGPRILTFSPRDYYIDESPSESLAIIAIGGRLHVYPLDDLGIYNVKDEGRNTTMIVGSAQVIAKRTRSLLKTEIDDFEWLINKEDLHEHELQNFFELHPAFLLGEDYKSIRSNIILPCRSGSDLIPDFFLEPIIGNLWDIVELKLPRIQQIVEKARRERFSHNVYEACAQLRTYRNYFDEERHREAIQQKYGIWAYKPKVAVIIGRSIEVDELIRRQIESDLPWVRVVTYDDLLEKAKHRMLA